MLLTSLLFGIALGNPYGKLVPEEAWMEKFTKDFEALPHAAAFKHWAKTFGKTYESVEEEAERFLVFKKNWEMINEHNQKEGETFTMKLNQFGDLTGDEFKVYVNGPSGVCVRSRTVKERVAMEYEDELIRSDVPDSIDWTNVDGKSYVTAVKDQGSCGSCWSFSTTGAIESAIAIKEGKTGDDIVTLSEQQLVDCSSSYGNMGCDGGLMDDAFQYVIANGGLCSEEEYPYTAKTGKTCLASSCGTQYDAISSYTDVTADDEQALMQAVAKGPVSIAIEADQTSFQFYSGGVLSSRCGDRLDHGVLVVGYGEEDGTEFWKVKNSWGTTWGEDGYILLCRDCDKNKGEGECGILSTPSYPVA